jgi:hypothetical protein
MFLNCSTVPDDAVWELFVILLFRKKFKRWEYLQVAELKFQ